MDSPISVRDDGCGGISVFIKCKRCISSNAYTEIYGLSCLYGE